MDKVLQQDLKKTSQVALNAFFNIMNDWQTNTCSQQALLGVRGTYIYEQWRQSDTVNLTEDELIRISYIVGIYKGLAVIFKEPSQAKGWINKQNDHFGGVSALEYMHSGAIDRLQHVRTLVDGQLS